MNAGYYKTTIDDISGYRSNLIRFAYAYISSDLIASLWFVDSQSKVTWDQSHTQLPPDDPEVLQAIAQFPNMEIK